MTVSRARTADAAVPGRRRPRKRLSILAVPTGVALATAALAAGPARAAPTGYSEPNVGYGGLCLDVRGSSTADFTPVQVYGCNGTDAQQWTLTLAGSTLQALGKCLDVQYGGTADGTPVDLFDCNGTGAQVWVPQGNGEFFNPQSDKCLDDTGWSTSSGTQAQIWDCTGSYNQSWSEAWTAWENAHPGPTDLKDRVPA